MILVKFINLLLKKIPVNILRNIAQRKPIDNYNRTVRDVSAYREFLRNNSQEIKSISTINEFSRIPLSDKKNYILKNNIEDLLKHDFYKYYTVEKSSGYSGNPMF